MLEFAVVELTDKCNLRCKHCYGSFSDGKTLNDDDIDIIIHELKDNGCKRVTLSGGEPCILGERLFDIADRFKKEGFVVALVTNGTMVGIDVHKYSCFDIIQVSIDGLKDVHESIRGKGTFLKSIDSILSLKKVVKKVFAQITINSINQYDFFKLLAFLDSLDIDLSVERVSLTGRASELDDIDFENYDKILKKVIDRRLMSSDPLLNAKICSINNIVPPDCFRNGCSAVVRGIAINTNLDVLPCVRIRRTIGNLATKGLEQVLESRESEAFKANIRGNKLCEKCRYENVCGGCKADNMVEECMLFIMK